MKRTADQEPKEPTALELFEVPHAVEDQVLTTIDVDSIDFLDDAPAEHEVRVLADSIRRIGLMNPPTVVEIPGRDRATTRYRVIAGRRRVAALKVLEVATTDAYVRSHKRIDAKSQAALLLSENGVRRDNPIEEMKAIDALLEAGMEAPAIAKSVGRGLPWVKQRIELSALNDALQNCLQAGGMTLAVARQVAKLTPAQQNKLVKRCTANSDPDPMEVTARDVAELLKPKEAQDSMLDTPARDMSLKGRLARLSVEMAACADVLTAKFGPRYAMLAKHLRENAALTQSHIGRMHDDSDATGDGAEVIGPEPVGSVQ